MNEYKVTGKYQIWEADTATTHQVCRVVKAESIADALVLIDADLPVDAWWDDDETQAVETLASLERRALADWNAQRPTASPNALAMARGEI